MSMFGTVFLLLLLAVTRFEATAAIPAGIEDSDGYGKQRETPFLHMGLSWPRWDTPRVEKIAKGERDVDVTRVEMEPFIPAELVCRVQKSAATACTKCDVVGGCTFCSFVGGKLESGYVSGTS